MSSPVALTSLPTALAPAPAALANLPVATLGGPEDLLAALSALAASASLSGTVVWPSSTSDAVPLLLTALGTVTIEAPIPLPNGARLTLQSLKGAPGKLAIVTVDDAPAIPLARSSLAPPPPEPTQPAPPAFLDLGTEVTAIVVAPPPSPTELPNGTATETNPVGENGPQPPAEASLAAESVTAPPPSADPPPSPAPTPSLGHSAAALLRGRAAASASASLPAGPSAAAWAPPVKEGSAAPGRALPSLRTPPALPLGTGIPLRVVAVDVPQAPTAHDDGARPPAFTGKLRPFGPFAALVETSAGAVQIEPAPKLPAGTPVALRLLPGTPASAILTIAGDGGAADAPLPQQAAVSLPAASEGTSGEAPRRMSEPAPASPTIEAAGSDASVATAGLSPPQSKSGPAAGPLTVRIVLPAAGTEPRAAGSSASLALVASVIAEPGAATAASTLLRSPLGTLALTPRLAVPPGSLLLLELPGSLPNFAPDGGDHDGATTAAWPSLQTALAAVAHTAPELAAQLRADLSAAVGDRLAASFLLILAVLRGAEPIAWPGESFDHALILAGRADLKERVEADLAALRDIAADPVTTPWQVFTLPLIEGERLRPIRLYLKRRPGDQQRARGREEESARFILEFELTRMGALQLDGFVRRRRFDLILRSRAPLAPALRADVARIFHERLAAAEFSGAIDFATVERFEIAPLDAFRSRVGLAV